MADINMCANEECPLKVKCYRHRADPSSWQTYKDFQFTKTKTGLVSCKDFMKVWNQKGKNETNK